MIRMDTATKRVELYLMELSKHEAKMKLKNADAFYDMDEKERRRLIGEELFVEDEKGTRYFPVLLSHGEFNYGKREGLIRVSEILNHPKTYPKWFRVSAFSPDDLDIDLDFEETHLRADILDYIRAANKKDVTYKGFLGNIQEHFKAGQLS